jgi:hypothetical protein
LIGFWSQGNLRRRRNKLSRGSRLRDHFPRLL